MTVSRQTHDQVVAVLDRLVEAACSGDGAALAGLAAPEFGGFWIGRAVDGPTGFGAAMVEPFALAGIEVSCEGTIAWVTACLVREDLPARDGRFTAVLRGTGHAWLVAQVHASLPA